MQWVLALTSEQMTFIVVIGIGVVALAMVVLAALALARWVVRRKAKPTGVQPPMEAPELYDLRTADVTDDIRFCVEMARQVGGPVLELGAGTGRITLPLARTGLVVTGLETSRLMLQRAKMKAEQLSSKLRVEWVEGDITNFHLGGRKFRLILAPFNVLQELRDLAEIEKCLGCVAEHLEPTGKFIVIVQPPRWEALKVERRFLKAVYSARTSEVVNCYQSLEVDPIWQKLRGVYEYEIWDSTGHVHQMLAPFEGSYLTCPEMALLLRAAGMQLEAVYGSFAREPLTVQSKQMVFIARPLQPASLPAAPQKPAVSASQSAKQPALVGASAAAANPPTASGSAPASPPAGGPVTVVLPETKNASAATASDATSTSLPALPPPGGPGSASSSSGSAQALQAPTSPPTKPHTTGQRRRSKPTH
jgi:ubiquinone/menaquinone biosynthesis C-methylase UbiE